MGGHGRLRTGAIPRHIIKRGGPDLLKPLQPAQVRLKRLLHLPDPAKGTQLKPRMKRVDVVPTVRAKDITGRNAARGNSSVMLHGALVAPEVEHTVDIVDVIATEMIATLITKVVLKRRLKLRPTAPDLERHAGTKTTRIALEPRVT